jgi:tetratricopeptide (TPR) repeat protein
MRRLSASAVAPLVAAAVPTGTSRATLSRPDAALGPTAALRTPLDAGFQFELAGALDRAIACYEEALATERAPAARAEVHLRIARVHRNASAWDAARDAAHAAARLALDAGAPDLAAEAMNVEVGVYVLRGDFGVGDALAESALALAVAPRVRGLLLQNRGAFAAQQSDFAAADAYFARSVEEFSLAGYEYGMAVALINGAAAARDAGTAARAVTLGRSAIAIARRLDALDLLGLAMINLAHALADTGELDAAEDLTHEAYGHFASTNNAFRQAECLEVVGVINARRAEHDETALRCFERAHAVAGRVGATALRGRIQGRLEVESRT